jgi:predicted transcriptional regulator
MSEDIHEYRKESKRSRITIILEVLEIIRNNPGIRKTRLQFKSNLSWVTLEEIIPFMEWKKVIEIKNRGYYPAGKAYQIIENWKMLKRELLLEDEHQPYPEHRT